MSKTANDTRELVAPGALAKRRSPISPEVGALNSVLEALEPLNQDQQSLVLQTVGVFLQLSDLER